jgi:hypothetical protein
MSPLTDRQLRTAFVNLSKGEASRVNVPADLDRQPWDDLDYLGWRDPKAPMRAYLATEREGRLCAVGLRLSSESHGARKTMCALCHTVGDVALMVAPRAGRAGSAGNTVGTYICADLACSLYVRGRRKPANTTTIAQETLTPEQKASRLVTNLDAFLARVLRAA